MWVAPLIFSSRLYLRKANSRVSIIRCRNRLCLRSSLALRVLAANCTTSADRLKTAWIDCSRICTLRFLQYKVLPCVPSASLPPKESNHPLTQIHIVRQRHSVAFLPVAWQPLACSGCRGVPAIRLVLVRVSFPQQTCCSGKGCESVECTRVIRRWFVVHHSDSQNDP